MNLARMGTPVPGSSTDIVPSGRHAGTTVAVYILNGILSAIFNGASMYVLWSDHSIMEEVELIFIRALSAQDLVSGVYLSFTYSYNSLSPEPIHESVTCGAIQTLLYVLMGQIQLLLMLLTLDRYLKITRPFRYIRWVNAFRAKIAIGVVLVLPLPLLMLASLPRTPLDFFGGMCVYPFAINRLHIEISGVLLMNLTISLVLNLHLLWSSYQLNRRTGIVSETQNAARPGNVRKGALTIFTLNVVSYTAWALFAFQVFALIGPDFTLSEKQTAAIDIIWQITTWCNPFILGLTNRSYRKAAKKALFTRR